MFDTTQEFVYKNTKYNKESFMEAFSITSDEDFENIVQTMYKKGLVKYALIDNNSNAKSAFDRFMEEEAIHTKAETHRAFEEADDINRRNQKTESQPKYKAVKFQFANIYDARSFIQSVMESAIPSDNIMMGVDNSVTVADITQEEANKLTVIYQSQKAVAFTTRTIHKTARAATNVTGYVAANVAVPVVKTGLRAAGSVAKCLFSTLAKAGSAVISTAADTVKEVAVETAEDPDIIKAKDDIIGVKDNIRNKVGNFGINGVSYIN